MYAATVFVSLLAVVSAVPTNGGHNTQEAQACHGEVKCCDSATADKILTQGNLLPITGLNELLGKCTKVNVLAVPIGSECKDQTVCCQNVQQNGFLNIACTPIQLI
ncbi:Hydrophobin [Cordyceps fumosorosea ARSEF 2679]|uniref:Hydrophobin n=1 Tax=Cordyceps fumosorosea (strain ARSEF 2679) TaxID=1081104 RepID=A0A162JQL8_CORFA|nr:Hydrophobin [Cordyceps fumosorosea ARSEF 2679]OAA72342.1 Hydrophobin [Cordyceps fumosorosea ARSEF 2679]